MLQRLRLPDTTERIAAGILDKLIDPFQNRLIRPLPFAILILVLRCANRGEQMTVAIGGRMMQNKGSKTKR